MVLIACYSVATLLWKCALGTSRVVIFTIRIEIQPQIAAIANTNKNTKLKKQKSKIQCLAGRWEIFPASAAGDFSADYSSDCRHYGDRF